MWWLNVLVKDEFEEPEQRVLVINAEFLAGLSQQLRVKLWTV